MHKQFILTLTCLSLFNISYANSYANTPNNCIQLHIQISNLTKNACILTNHTVMHGNLVTPPPYTILPNDSKRFDMTQGGYGPELITTYKCGNESITLNSQQNYCIVSAGNISGAVMEPQPQNLEADYEAIMGSVFWSKAGSINWKIIERA